MKFVKLAVLSASLLFAAVAQAESVEEVCYNSAEANVKLKRIMQRDPAFLQFALSESEKSTSSPYVKERMRENYYWVFNRRTMSDEDIRRLSFIGCLVRLS